MKLTTVSKRDEPDEGTSEVQQVHVMDYPNTSDGRPLGLAVYGENTHYMRLEGNLEEFRQLRDHLIHLLEKTKVPGPRELIQWTEDIG